MIGEGPEIRYADIGSGKIAYQVVGNGPIDLLFLPSWFSNIELMWESPAVARFLQRLATFSRLVLLDRRGSGLSDAVPTADLTLENRAIDVLTVLDAVGSERAALFGAMYGGTTVAHVAAIEPARVDSLVLYNSTACLFRHNDYPFGVPEDLFVEGGRVAFQNWGHSDMAAQDLSPSHRSWWHRYQRQSLGPTDATDGLHQIARADIRADLAAIEVPTLVIHRTENPLMVLDHAEYLVQHIRDARLLALPGADPGWTFDAQEPVLDEIQEFLTGRREELEPARALATVMFTDLVDSTARAASVGDVRWRDELEHHDAVVHAQLSRHDGHLVKGTGDGVLATFDRPSAALRCGRAIVAEMGSIGLGARVGIHTGEIEWRGDDVTGLAVVIAARVAALAAEGEVLATGTVHDLVVGSTERFEGAGDHQLKGVPGAWKVWRLSE